MNEFEKRDQAFENKFAHDQELEFKATVRRDKNIALWAAEKLGKSAEDTEKYIPELIEANMQKAGDEDLLEKIMADFSKAGVEIAESEVRREMARLLDVAREQIMTGK